LCPIRRKTAGFPRAQKNVVEQNATKGAARLAFCGTRAALAAKRLPFVICSTPVIYKFIE